MQGKLYIVPTPIGNLKDITLRALEVLTDVSLILAEDTRTSGKLLAHYQIQTPKQSYHLFNEHQIVEGLVARISTGESMALISDAGTPSISDPGFLLVRACVEQQIEVECLPGATAFVPALVNSGFAINSFVFEGFLPQKKGRQTKLLALKNEERTLVFYESPHRLLKTLTQFATFFGDERRASVSRELTKIYEETIRGTLKELIEHFSKTKPKGELVIVLERIIA